MFFLNRRAKSPSPLPDAPPLGERGSALGLSLILLVILTLFGMGALAVSSIEMQNAAKYKSDREAFYAAEAGVERARRQLKDAATWQQGFAGLTGVTLTYSAAAGVVDDQVADWGMAQPSPVTDAQRIRWSDIALDKGVYNVMAAGVNTSGVALPAARVRFVSTGTSERSARKVIEVVAIMRSGGKPANVRAAITVNSNVLTLGTLVVDGRNHDENGALVAPGGSGTLGLSTTQAYVQSGSSDLGGTSAGGTDFAPSKPGDPAIIETNAAWAFPTSPDEVMGGDAKGWPEGTLKSIAQSGMNGSQYVTDPSQLTYPLSGVTYVELPSGDVWQSMDFGSPPNHSSGIVVVHNTATNALMKNLNGGTFKGLIIADDVVHIQNTIIGALVSLTTGPSEGNCIGNGNGDVLYSLKTIADAAGAAGGGGVYHVSWRELY